MVPGEGLAKSAMQGAAAASRFGVEGGGRRTVLRAWPAQLRVLGLSVVVAEGVDVVRMLTRFADVAAVGPWPGGEATQVRRRGRAAPVLGRGTMSTRARGWPPSAAPARARGAAHLNGVAPRLRLCSVQGAARVGGLAHRARGWTAGMVGARAPFRTGG